jgi:hypothetical protein
MYSTINTYRNETIRTDLAMFAAERRVARSAARRGDTPVAPSPTAGTRNAVVGTGRRTSTVTAGATVPAVRQAVAMMCAVLALAIALAVPLVA